MLVNKNVPKNTKKVPIQCQNVNLFPKYTIDISKLTNFLSVVTSVTVNDVHSVVKTNTLEMQTYLFLKKLKIVNHFNLDLL